MLCACGCGLEVKEGNRFILGHNRRTFKPEPQLCLCGCGEYANSGNEFIHGHNMKGRSCKVPPEPQLCECGCGEYAQSGNRFIRGHNSRVDGNMPPYSLGREVSEETREKLSIANSGKKGIPWSEEQKMKLSATLQGIPYDAWESYACESLYCPKFDETCRESNRDKYDRRCFICDKTEEVNGQKLSVHHVDMTKNQGCDGIGWKLIPLCRSCHAKAHGAEIISRLEYILAPLYKKVVSCI